MPHVQRGIALALLPLLAEVCMAQPPQPPKLPDMPAPAPAENADRFGRMIPRTMRRLATSTPQKRKPVRILFYGQSITVQPWWKTVAATLHKRFPHADLTVQNKAIGGFGISRLRRTAEHDLYGGYPDLLVLHAYGVGRGQLDKFVAEIRRRTTCEIVLWTHHVCVQKRRDGESDADFAKRLAKHQQRRDKASEEIRRVAKTYGCELVEVRKRWKRYLADNDLQPKELLGDHIHLNKKGWAVMAPLIADHFRYVEGAENPWSDCVETREVQPGEGGRILLTFKGNRVDAVAADLPANAPPPRSKVRIDGKPPSANPRLYGFTRPSKAPHAWYPALLEVGHKEPLLRETWMLRVTESNKDATELHFTVAGSKTGPDGAGVSTKRFVSASGRVVIEPDAWNVAGAIKWFKKPMPEDFAVTWKAVGSFVDTFQPGKGRPAGAVKITTLASGLENAAHTLEIVPTGGKPVGASAVRIHRPPVALLPDNAPKE